MTDSEKRQVDELLAKIEKAAGEIADRRGNAPVIAEILTGTNGLRSLLGVLRTH